MCFCTPSIRTPFCGDCNQAMFLRIGELKKQLAECQKERDTAVSEHDKLITDLDRLRVSFQFGEFNGIEPDGCNRAIKFINEALAKVGASSEKQ